MTTRILLPLLCVLPTLALAQGSKISQVLVYPGGATVERVAKVAAGSQVLKLSCLTTRFDLDSLQLDGDAGMQIGDVSVQTLARERAPECAASPLDARIRELEDAQAGLKAEIEQREGREVRATANHNDVGGVGTRKRISTVPRSGSTAGAR